MRQSRADKADEARRKAAYRRRVLTGECRIPLGALKKLLGPDCAYRLYSAPQETSRNE